jgi:Fic family protein
VFDPAIPYNELPLLPPRDDVETPAVLRKTTSAARALAKLDGALRTLPNPMLFLDTIHLQEAKASSEIENIVTTNDALFRAFVVDVEPKDQAVKEVLNYKNALAIGLKALETRPFISTNLCVEIVQGIKRNHASIRNIPGTKLETQHGEVVYTPPSGEQVIRDKLQNWERFINDADSSLDPLVKMALMHYQFEAIHPFSDGNGRTGRILLLLFLKTSGLLEIPAIYLSGFIIRTKTEYYDRLRGVTEQGKWEPFILYMLTVIEETAKREVERLTETHHLMETTAQIIREKLPRIYSKDLIEILFHLPYARRQQLVDSGLGNLKTVSKYLQLLEEQDVLRSVTVGKAKLYINWQLLRLLERPLDPQ